MMSAPSIPGFLRLPLELRYEIYSYLSVKEPVCYPYHRSPITSISHAAPPLQLLLTCHKICDEVLAHYYGTATLRILALGSSQVKREDMGPATIAAIRQAKKMELMLMWNLTTERAKTNQDTWPWWMNGWMCDQVQLLKDEGHRLEVITISLTDASIGGTWETKKPLFAPLQELKNKVRFEVGNVITAEDAEGVIKRNIDAYVMDLNRQPRGPVQRDEAGKRGTI